MILFDAGNVLLKPAQKKQLMSRLKRSIRLGDRIGDFLMKISMRRSGRHVEMTATGHDRFGEFAARSRGQNWTDALHSIVRALFCELHKHSIRRAVYAVA